MKSLNIDEIRKITKEKREVLIENEMHYILNMVYFAAEEGEYFISVNIKYEENIKILKDKGYKVDMSLGGYKISWYE